ncbi:MAG: UvrD-helicase domain-containing protein, partial [Thiotrichaceae bacterium]|nr:UvrD-helicase domain-containing protein [Thiotrichaceae bacterium]
MTLKSGKNQPTVYKLDALTFPLYGQRLIEASAGTGKTYTIASLFIRLLLGHGKTEASDGTCSNNTNELDSDITNLDTSPNNLDTNTNDLA